MNEQIFKSLFPDEYIDRFLKENMRVDNRLFTQSRNIMIQKKQGKVTTEKEEENQNFGVLVSVGGTIVQGSLVSKKLKKGVWGIQRSLDNPVTLNITGDENSQKIEEKQAVIRKNLLDIYKKNLEDVFDNVKPDELEFETLTVNLRVHIDMGNKITALFLAGLTCLYMLKAKRKKEMDEEIDILFPLNFLVINKDKVLVDPSVQEERHKQNSEVLLLRCVQNNEVKVVKVAGKQIKFDQIEEMIGVLEGFDEEILQYTDFLNNDEKKVLRIF